MPLYEYRCPKCGVFEVIRKFSDEPLTVCPTCGAEIQKLASAPAFHLKGTGWYVTDYAKKSSGEADKGKADEGKAGESKPGEGKPAGGKSADAKPAEGKAGEGKPEGKASESKSSEGKSETKAAKDSPGTTAAPRSKKSDRS